MTRRYPYYPAWNGKITQPITAKFVELAGKRWKTKNLGTYVNRTMRGKTDLSVHATGYACDLGADLKTLQAMWDYLIAHTLELRISEIHFYKAPGTKHGLGYRSSRGEGMAGVKKWTATDNGGSGGLWLHVELEKQDVENFEQVFRATKPK